MTRRDATGQSAWRKPHGQGAFGRYNLILKIGEGSTGQTFLAHARGDSGFERLFAIKVIEWNVDDDSFIRAFMRDAEIASTLRHPNVVGVVEAGSFPDGRYVVMDYVKGGTLGETLRRHRESRLPRLVIPVVIDALNGLHAAHSIKDESGRGVGLVHRSLTPRNLLIGIDGACRVTDFGCGRAHVVARGPRSDAPAGAPAFTSPEQIMGAALDPRSDVFSTGVVLWNALTGKNLFHGTSEHETVFNVLKRKVPRPSAIGLLPPASLDPVVMKALERDPQKRFQSAEEMAFALGEVTARAGFLGAPSEIARWVTTTFASDLDARRREIHKFAEQSKVVRLDGRPPMAPTSPSPPRAPTAGDARDFLSVDELSHGSDAAGAAHAMPSPPPLVGASRRSPRARVLALAVAVAALGAIVGLRWVASRPAEPATAEPPARSTVAPAPAPPPPVAEAAAVHVAATPDAPVATAATPVTTTVPPAPIEPPTEEDATARVPAKAAKSKPGRRPSEAKPSSAEPAAAVPEKDPGAQKPDPAQQPEIEPNPYLYK